MEDMKRELKAKDLLGKEPIVERPQTQTAGIFYLLYEAKKGADFSVFNTEFAKEVKKIESLATGRDDFKEFCKRFDNAQYPACDTVMLSALRFMYPSQFNADEAKYVIAQLEKETVMKAHKIMGPCVDNFHLMTPQALWPTATLGDVTKLFSGRSCDAKDLLTAAEEQASFEFSQRIVAITLKLDGKGEAPVEDMPTLAKFVAYMKELPSQAMFVDFHVDNKFNTSNPKSQFTRSILPFGGPLDRNDIDGVRLYLNTSHDKDKQTRATKQYIIDKLEKDFAKTASGSYSDKIQVYYFMTALIFDVFIQVSLCPFSVILKRTVRWLPPHAQAHAPRAHCSRAHAQSLTYALARRPAHQRQHAHTILSLSRARALSRSPPPLSRSLSISLSLALSFSDSIDGRRAGRFQRCLGLHLHLGCHWISFLGGDWYV
jgi:hypothetical protein